VFIARAAKLALEEDEDLWGTIFYDVSTDDSPGWWAVREIEACYNAGIISGYPGRVYRPTNEVTRAQFCKFIVNAVNSLHVGAIPVPALADLTQDDCPFADVVAEDDPDTEDVNEQNPLAHYIIAAAQPDFAGATAMSGPIVAGFPLQGDAELPNFKPANSVTRGQLAKFVWGGVMRDLASAVVLGGPGVTQAIDSTLIDGDNLAAYSGLTNFDDYLQADDPDAYLTAYVTLDGMRLDGAFVVDFELRDEANRGRLNDAKTPSETVSVAVSAPAVAAAKAAIVGVDVMGRLPVPAGGTNGEPYVTIAKALTIGPGMDLEYGVYEMTTKIGGYAIGRKVLISVMAPFFEQDFELGLDTTTWEAGGTGSPAVYGVGLDATVPDDPADAVEELYVGSDDASLQSLEFFGNQYLLAGSPDTDTTGRHNIRLSMDLAAVDFGDGDSLVVSWSKDGGATWIEAFSIAGEDAPAELTNFSADLPNGLEYTDPDAWDELDAEEQADPANWGADDNDQFMVKIEIITDDNEDARGYIDNVDIRGT
jgi:hypothetical protein